MTSDHKHHHHHSHKGAHGCGKNPRNSALRGIFTAFLLNLFFSLVELIGGWWTQSIAIQADAIHDFGDSMILAAALGMQYYSGISATQRYPYGFKRWSLLSALLSSLVLLGGSIYIIIGAVLRLNDPVQPRADGMFVLALLGVVFNGFSAWNMSHGHSQNERALSWHMIEDLLGWIAVLIGSIVMQFTNAPWLDPIMSLVISGVVIMGAIRSFWSSSMYFLQAAPKLDFGSMRQQISELSGVADVEALKAWSLDGEHHVATLSVQITCQLDSNSRAELKSKIRGIVESFGKLDSTIEFIEM